MAETGKDDTGELTFEEAISRLTEIVNSIETGRVSLQESLGQYERGMALIKRCREILIAAEKRIEKISAAAQDDAGGSSEPERDTGD